MRQPLLPDRFKEAIRTGDTSELEVLLASNRELANQLIDDFPPLWLAVAKGYAEVVKLLLKRGASVAFADRSAYRLLHKAAEYGRYAFRPTPEGMRRLKEEELEAFCEIMQLLIRAGANVNETWEGHTPLEIAAREASADMLRLLLKRGAVPYPGNNHILCKASLSSREPVEKLQVLLQNGVYPVSGDDSCFPLVTVARMVKDSGLSCTLSDLLLGAGAQVNAVDHTGVPPLAWAVVHQNIPLVELLLEYGARRDVKIRRECNESGLTRGETAYSIARKQNHQEVLLLMRKFPPERKTAAMGMGDMFPSFGMGGFITGGRRERGSES